MNVLSGLENITLLHGWKQEWVAPISHAVPLLADGWDFIFRVGRKGRHYQFPSNHAYVYFMRFSAFKNSSIRLSSSGAGPMSKENKT